MLKDVVQLTRNNHALEHATINVLTKLRPGLRISGFSGPWGFLLLTELPLEVIVDAVQRAQQGLRSGNTELAFHERCGTNAVVTATLTTLATLLALGRRKKIKAADFWLERFPLAILLNSIVLIFAPRIASYVQRNISTDADIGDLKVTSVLESTLRGIRHVQVRTG